MNHTHETRERISVALAAYNSERYIKQQIDSILNQLQTDDELIISYNESDDRTLEILQQYSNNDNRIKVLYCAEKGFRSNFNNAVINCSGQYIFLSDHDDVWVENKIEEVLIKFKSESADVVVHGRFVTDEDLNIISTIHVNPNECGFLSTIIKNPFTGCCMAFRREIVPIICPFPSRIVYHDVWIGALANIYGTISVIDKPLIYYRRHGDNESKESRRHYNKIIKERVVTVLKLIARIIEVSIIHRKKRSQE